MSGKNSFNISFFLSRQLTDRMYSAAMWISKYQQQKKSGFH